MLSLKPREAGAGGAAGGDQSRARRGRETPSNDNFIGSIAPSPESEADAEWRYRLAAFPPGAKAVIERRGRSVTQIGRARENEWKLRFEPQSRVFVDPLTGWTGGSDPLRHVEWRFATLKEAVRYAERHGLPYRVNGTLLPQTPRPKTKEVLHEHAA